MIGQATRILRHMGPSGLVAALVRSGRAAIARDLFGQRFVRRRIYDYEMWLDTRDRGISRTLILFGRRELEHRVMLEMLMKPGMIIFDIGANIGYYALMEHRLLRGSGKIIAIEPSQANANLLRRNLALNRIDDVTVLEAAVSDTDGDRDFYLAPESNLNTFHPDPQRSQAMRTVTVATTTLPALAKKYGAPNLVRMDVEGHEVEVLDGAMTEIEARRMSPSIIFEVHRRRYGPNHDFAKTLRRLFAAGYRVPLVGSSQESGTLALRERGYVASEPIRTDFMTRAIFRDIRPDDAIDLICTSGGVRTVVLARD
ncbi:MAG: FkbM family methyltransferase [Alphaproteobacteria bacterium]|nr:FkbM family methyltransferase [Alphaproteobacteria bacterium]